MRLPNVPSPGFLSALPESERKRLGRAGITQEEAEATFRRGQEKHLQKLVAQWLDLHEIYYDCDRMDQKTSGRKGRADFRICYRGYWISIECKASGESLTKEQAQEAVRVRKSGGRFALLYHFNDLIKEINEIDRMLD